MKKLFSISTNLLFISLITLLSCSKINTNEINVTNLSPNINPEYFYYYKGQKQALTLNTEYMSVVSKKKLQENYEFFGVYDEGNAKVVKKQDGNDNTVTKSEKKVSGKIKLNNKLTASEYFDKIQDLYEDPNVEHVSPYFYDGSALTTYSSYFRVKLYSESDYYLLVNMANNYGVEIIQSNQFMPLWYTLNCTNLNQDALQMANLFFQSGYFSAAEPDFLLYEQSLNCTDDPLYSSQWGGNNNGQYGGITGIDTKSCEVFNLVLSGSIISVSVIDRGIEPNHEDLYDMWGTMRTYNCETGGASVIDQTPTYNGRANSYSHGVAVAGIIGAHRNSVGTRGVAPHCRLMSVSHSFSITRPNPLPEIANGINWSVAQGADIINISWISQKSQIIEDAITGAMTYGRNGKGCVIVASAGNSPGLVHFPASIPNVISVGAINQCGYLLGTATCESPEPPYNYGSSYGNEIDVVAPGVRISTTDMMGAAGYNSGNYMDDFSGTSAAAPFVSGVAALILAKNKDLTTHQVRNIIESTTQKVGYYSYSNHSGRNNGTWNTYTGYGLVNAYAAILNTPTRTSFEPGEIFYMAAPLGGWNH